MWQLASGGRGTCLRLSANYQTRPENVGEGDLGLGSIYPNHATPQDTFGARDMSGLRRYEVALEAEEDSAHPREQKLEPLRDLMSCLSSGLGTAPQRSGRSLLCRTAATAAQPAGALKI
uniref:Uncharacterized protein LOC109694669 isoform X3 n=1 Tax=Castor canadensis TaxID=51338 RepID=A0A8B7VLE3_CASCN|nr:uncharacterized protein LOC109694669 isoform X3 [Castor canadensis]